MRLHHSTIILTAVALASAAGCEYVVMPEAALDHYVKGQLLHDRGEYDAALTELIKATQTDPKMSVAYEAIGDIHRRRGSYDLARRSYESACRINPYAFRPHYNLGVTYQALAEIARIAEKVEELLRHATFVYLRAVTIQPKDFEANLNLSACYFQLGRYELAEQYCKAAIRVNARNPQAYSNLGIIYDSQNRLYDAVKAYKTSLEFDTHQPQVLLNLASTFRRQGRLKKAIRTYELAAQENPNKSGPWERIGMCYFHMRDMDNARRFYEKAIAIDAENASAHRGLGAVYMSQFLRGGRKRDELWNKGLQEWQTSLEIDPQQPGLEKLVKKYSPKYAAPEL